MRRERTAWIIGGVGVLGCVIGWILMPAVFAHAWLGALACWIGWPLGCMALLLIHSISGGRWGYAARPALIFGVLTLPLVLLGVIPLLVERHALYPWAREGAGLGNATYLNVPFACGRTILYLVLWLGLAVLVLGALRREPTEAADAALYRLSPAGLIMLMLTATFAGFDGVLSLDPHFNSSIFGMIVAGEGVLFALAVTTLLTLLLVPPPPRIIADLAKLLLGLLLLWSYFVFMQLLIVWNSDLSNEARWYVARTTHGWGIIAGLIFLFHVFIPFFMLIWPQVQRSRRAMLAVCLMLIGGEILRGWWLTAPAQGRALSWVDVVAMLAFGGLAAGIGIRAQRMPSLANWVPRHG